MSVWMDIQLVPGFVGLQCRQSYLVLWVESYPLFIRRYAEMENVLLLALPACLNLFLIRRPVSHVIDEKQVQLVDYVLSCDSTP